jgi:cyclopropane-fatty-acyl-phospholipid synthase
MLLPMTDLNAGEAYLRDDIDIEGDMVAALHATARLTHAMTWLSRLQAGRHLLSLPKPPDGLTAAGRIGNVIGRSHSRPRDEATVRFHYDLGNDFFRQYLDNDWVYSCAYFADPQMPLEVAQRRKLDTVARKLALRPGQRLLDVGCGWGSFAIHAARSFGVHAVGVTLSTRQAELARERVAAAEMQDRVEIRLADYREITETFDAISSIGMVEHVGAANLPSYFAHLASLLRDGGRLLNHNITTGRRMQVRDLHARDDESFVANYVFPDGSLTPAWRTIRDVEQAGLELIDVQQLRPHYALTLREWVRRLEANHDAVVAVASEAAYRTWRAYMSGSVVGFETNDLGVIQVLAAKGAHTLPLDRSYMAPRAADTLDDDTG